MSANSLDPTTYTDVAGNTVFDAVLDATKILAWRLNVKNVVNQNATEINGKVSADGTVPTTKLRLTDATTLTIASGEITVTQSLHLINTEGSAATDDLVTINGGVNGDRVIIVQSSGTRDVTIKAGTGNIRTLDGTDCEMFGGTASGCVEFVRVSGLWFVIGNTGVKRSGDAMIGKLTATNQFYNGTGTPEGIVTAAVGAIFQRSDGGASTTLYVKQSGSSNTGWVAK